MPQNTTSLRPVMNVSSPIGLFDSGVGGLSVYQHLRVMMPNERYLYYADTKNVPYGSRSSTEIQQFTQEAVSWLVQAGCKIIIIACNSASAYALHMMREQYPDVPIVGLVPALKPAVLASQTKHVAVLATQATLSGELLSRVIAQVASVHNVQVTKWYDPNLVPWVESGMPLTDQTALDLVEMLDKFNASGVDQIVLGCTHYPFFREFLLAQIQKRQYTMSVVDSGRAIAMRAYDLLQQAGLLQVQASDTKNNVAFNLDTNSFALVANESLQGAGESISAVVVSETPYLQFFASKLDARLLMLVEKLLSTEKSIE
ncbi:glutamate racemase [Psychrobacter sp. I-STPA6b]|uniref:glutamate racemase n=1 Tax=Psychrobacter sp. I-STPA6b TaxID=2585718 RepID=UPI001D0CCEEE|nr:glutamate racemase [Psychrobacter sp. I-STPA6b]